MGVADRGHEEAALLRSRPMVGAFGADCQNARPHPRRLRRHRPRVLARARILAASGPLATLVAPRTGTSRGSFTLSIASDDGRAASENHRKPLRRAQSADRA